MDVQAMNDTTLLRLPELRIEQGNRSRSSLYNDIQNGLLTAPVKIGRQAVAWPAAEIAAINRARIGGKSDAEIRALVSELHAARKRLAEAA